MLIQINQINKLAMGVENKTSDDSKHNDSPAFSQTRKTKL